jgi:hypothetical protein
VKVLKEAIATTAATHAAIDAETQNSLHQHLDEAIARSGDNIALSNQHSALSP